MRGWKRAGRAGGRGGTVAGVTVAELALAGKTYGVLEPHLRDETARDARG